MFCTVILRRMCDKKIGFFFKIYVRNILLRECVKNDYVEKVI